MKRRLFLGWVSTASAVAFLAVSCRLPERRAPEDDITAVRRTTIDRIGSRTLGEWKDYFERHLRERIIPTWYVMGIDHEYGGFMCDITRQGTYETTEKHGWYQGRGLWLFSHLYNHFDRDERHLEVIRKTKEFILRHMQDAKGDYLWRVTRTGEPLGIADNIFTDIYVALGMAEYFLATRDEEARAEAERLCYRIWERVTDPSFQYRGNEPGLSMDGIWLHFLFTLSAVSGITENADIVGITDAVIRRISNYHMDRELKYVFGWLGPDLEPIPDKRGVSAGHVLQCAWIVMNEALRRGEAGLFREGIRLTKWTMEPSWDTVGGGGVVGFSNERKELPPPDEEAAKPSWRNDEALVALLLLFEQTHDPWAAEWFERVWKWTYRVYLDDISPVIDWNITADRQGNPDLTYPRKGNFHHPRSVLYILDSLNRQIERGGRTGDLLNR
jgi:N-acylglucosamine 2-epimerase